MLYSSRGFRAWQDGSAAENTWLVKHEDPARSDALLDSLGAYLETCGGTRSMVDGWYTKTEYRKEGATAGTNDSYFFSPQGKRFRSRVEVVTFLELHEAR